MDDESNARIQALTAERDALRAAQTWVETAAALPPQGDDLLCAWPSCDRPGTYVFGTATYAAPTHWHNPEDEEDDYIPPSHWMPLPPAPALAQLEQR